MNKIEEYALKIVADHAEGGLEHAVLVHLVLDEEGDNPEHAKAIDLALAIIRGMRANPEKVLALADQVSS